jgi:hypothetical protein
MKSKKTRLSLADLGRRITGFSTPFFGVSWKAPAAERETVRTFLTFLEDRRVLFNPYQLEVEYQVQQSVLQIREQCTKAISALPDGSPAIGPLRGIRAASRRFLDEPHADFRNFHRRNFDGHEGPSFFTALGEFRASVGSYVAALAVTYQVELELELATIVPAEDKDKDM